MNRSRWLLLVVAVVVLGGAWWVWRSRTAGSAAPRYRTVAVERGSIASTVSATGTVNPVVQVEVGSQVSGTVQKLYADYNQRVKAGQVLLQIEPSSFRARMVQAQASVARAQAAVADGQRQLKRSEDLIKDQVISQADLEAAQVTLQQRDADLEAAKAQLEAARVDLNNTTIKAPIDGVVISRAIDTGQTVAASLQAPKLFVLAADLSQMQVETKIDEADIGAIHQGLPVTFTVDAFPDVTFNGKVAQVRLEPITDAGVVTYTIVIRTENPDLKLRPGMTANVSVLVASRDDVLKVPNAALRFRPPAAAASGGVRRGGGALASTRGDVGPTGGGSSGGAMANGGNGAGGGQAGAGGGMRMRGGGGGAGGQHWKQGGGGQHMAQGEVAGEATESDPVEPTGLRPGMVYVLRAGKPTPVRVRSGITDGASTEVRSNDLQPGDQVIVGAELPMARAQGLTPPPGMGGPTFRGPRPAGGGGGGRGR